MVRKPHFANHCCNVFTNIAFFYIKFLLQAILVHILHNANNISLILQNHHLKSKILRHKITLTYTNASYTSYNIELYSIHLCPKFLSGFVLFNLYFLFPLHNIYTHIYTQYPHTCKEHISIYAYNALSLMV